MAGIRAQGQNYGFTDRAGELENHNAYANITFSKDLSSHE